MRVPENLAKLPLSLHPQVLLTALAGLGAPGRTQQPPSGGPRTAKAPLSVCSGHSQTLARPRSVEKEAQTQPTLPQTHDSTDCMLSSALCYPSWPARTLSVLLLVREQTAFVEGTDCQVRGLKKLVLGRLGYAE